MQLFLDTTRVAIIIVASRASSLLLLPELLFMHFCKQFLRPQQILNCFLRFHHYSLEATSVSPRRRLPAVVWTFLGSIGFARCCFISRPQTGINAPPGRETSKNWSKACLDDDTPGDPTNCIGNNHTIPQNNNYVAIQGRDRQYTMHATPGEYRNHPGRPGVTSIIS